MHEPIVFDDITPIEIPVQIAGQSYVLREASGDAVVRYENHRIRCTRFVDGKFAGIDGPINDGEPQLVADCLYRVSTSPDGKRVLSKVEEKVVRSWPARIQRFLFSKVKEISRIDQLEDEETIEGMRRRLAELEARRDEPKNLLGDMTVGSGLPTV